MSSPKRKRTYYYNTEWEEEFCFIEYNGKVVCLICNKVITLLKRSNLERHFSGLHSNFNTDFPLKSELRKVKIDLLKSSLTKQQSFFPRSKTLSKSATIASLRVSHLLAKKKKPFTDSETIKEAMLEAADSLFIDFKNKTEILNAINLLQMSSRTTTRRIELISDNLESKLFNDIENCKFFSLQLDESIDSVDTAQLVISIKMAFQDFSTKEEFLKILPLKGRTRGIDIFLSFKNFVEENKLPLEKLSSITTDGARAMVGKENGFIGLCRKDSSFPKFISYHCLIHQEMLFAKSINFDHVIPVVSKIINSIKAKATQHRLFKLFLENENAEFKDLLIHTEVRWLSRGKVLERFISLLPQIKEFLASKEEFYEELENKDWLLDLGFLVDMTMMFNVLNLKLQGKNFHVADMISAVNSFKCKLILLKTHLLRNSFSYFPSLKRMIEDCNLNVNDFDNASYVSTIEALLGEFSSRFQDFVSLELVIPFFINPFNVNDADLSVKISNFFDVSEIQDLEMEIISLQNDIVLKTHYQDKLFWKLVSEETYPILKKCALKIFSYCGTTYNCETLFSNMTYLKSKYRSQITDAHLDNCLRASNSLYEIDYEKIADDIGPQSHH